MFQYFIIGVWLVSVMSFVLIPSFPPQPPSAVGVIFFLSITVVATYLCFKSAVLKWQSEEATGCLDRVAMVVHALLAILGITLIFMYAYASLTTGIAVD